MAIDYENSAYRENIANWQLIDNICDGKNVEQYLRYLNPQDKSEENIERNKAYRRNAIFSAVAGYTSRGLTGTVFRKVPTLTIPASLDYLNRNVDGTGQSIYQQSQHVLKEVLRKGRCGLSVTYPKTGGDVSRADMASGKLFSTISKIDAEQIINTALVSEGAETKLGLVVIREFITETAEDGYTEVLVEELRELALDLIDGQYVHAVRRWRKDQKGEWQVISEDYPTFGAGTGPRKYWNEIPFTFVGSEDNSIRASQPPMLDIVRVNKGHYQNSADYEDSVWYAGQAQPWMSGITQEHIDLMKANGMYAGSRNVLGVPAGETFGYAVAPPNPMVRQAMLDKEAQMIGLGARFIQPGSANKTATQSEGEQEVQHSVLSLTASNVSEAYTQALKWVARFMAVPETGLEYALNQDFVAPNATPQDIAEMVKAWQAGALPQSDLFNWFKRIGRIDPEKDNEDIAEEVGPAPDMPDLDAE
jgi:hypothetical protein